MPLSDFRTYPDLSELSDYPDQKEYFSKNTPTSRTLVIRSTPLAFILHPSIRRNPPLSDSPLCSLFTAVKPSSPAGATPDSSP